tara:strand:- start:6084 stop:6470 length:387 start_codon:yes stop_codon:yes gene_type:complete
MSPASPESIEIGRNYLNSMLEMWLSEQIKIGTTPLDAPGDELNEPDDCRNGIISNLSIELSPQFDNGGNAPSAQLNRLASTQKRAIERIYGTHTVPKLTVSSTLPRGSGNRRDRFHSVYFDEGGKLDG